MWCAVERLTAVAGNVSRVAIAVNSLRGGGEERFALTLARELLKRGHAIDLLFRRAICDYSDEVPPRARLFHVTQSVTDSEVSKRRQELDESDVFRRATISGLDVPHWKLRYANIMVALYWRRWKRELLVTPEHARVAFRVAHYLDSEKPHALLAIGVKPPIWAVFANCFVQHSTRTVATLEGWPTEKRARIAASVLPFVDSVATVSLGCTRFLTDILRLRTPVHTIYQPLVGPDELRKAAELVEHPWIGGEVPVILSAGSLQKDYGNLLRAVAILSSRRPIKLIILAQDRQPWLSQAQEEACSLGIAGAVDFAGFVQNPYAFMARADLFVLSSRREGMPQVLVQAMMVGCKVVATDCPVGPAELLCDGEYGELVRVGQPDELADAMERELNTPRDTDRLRARAEALFGVGRAIDRYESLLLEATS